MKLDFSEKSMDIGTFPFNFVRTLMVAGTGGAEVSECLLAAGRVRSGDQESWLREWACLAERVHATANEAMGSRQPATARQAYLRASNYYRAAMFSLPHTDARLDRYLTASRACFHAAAGLFTPAIEVVEIPFGAARLPGYFMPADCPGAGPRPTLLVLNGGDSTNEEMVHWLGFAAVARNWNLLVFEGPGQWSAMQLNPGLRLRPDYEVPVAAAVDWLLRRNEVDADRIALFGPSLGSLLAARVAAFDTRLRACVCDGLVVDVYEAWHAVWPLVLRKASPRVFDAMFTAFERVSPQLRGITNHFRWMLGAVRPHEIIEAWRPFTVRDLAPRIRCPMLMLYGQAEVAQSNLAVTLSVLRFISQLTCPVSLHMFTYTDGWAASHCQIGGLAPMQALVFDWLDRAVNADQMPRLDLGVEATDLLSRALGRGKAGSEGRRILDELMSVGSRPVQVPDRVNEGPA